MVHETDTLRLIDKAAHNCWQTVQNHLQILADQTALETEPSQLKTYFELADKGARASTSLMKAITDAQDYNKRMEEAESQKAYTRYEDLPPLSPEDVQRFRERFNTLANAVSLRKGRGPFIPDIDGD